MSLSSIPIPSDLQPRLRFGLFEADLQASELRHNGDKVKLQELPFRALVVLLSRPNEIISRDEIRNALWPADVFVDFDRGITSAIKRLRDALGDSPENPIFIETIERRGYRWIAPLSFANPATATPAQSSDSNPVSVLPNSFPAAAPDELPSSALSWLGHKTVYILPFLALLLIAWSFRSAWHGTKAGVDPSRTASNIAAGVHPANQEARDLYLQGRYYWNKRTPDDLRKAQDDFTQAIVRDPGYADPYVGLADSYNLLREFSVMSDEEAFPRALAAARTAVKLDDRSSQAHASLAFATFYGLRDTVTAEREFRRSIELDPKNATAHHWYANALAAVGRSSDAFTEIERARAIDPTSRAVLADKGVILLQLGRTEESKTLLQQVEKAEPEFLSPHRYLKILYLATQDYPNYLTELKTEAVLSHDDATLASTVAGQKGLVAGGPHAMFENMRREQEKFYSQGKFSAYLLAQTCMLAGNRQDALKYLKAAQEEHDGQLAALKSDRIFVSLHDEPVFRQIAANVAATPVRAASSTTPAR